MPILLLCSLYGYVTNVYEFGLLGFTGTREFVFVGTRSKNLSTKISTNFFFAAELFTFVTHITVCPSRKSFYVIDHFHKSLDTGFHFLRFQFGSANSPPPIITGDQSFRYRRAVACSGESGTLAHLRLRTSPTGYSHEDEPFKKLPRTGQTKIACVCVCALPLLDTQ